MGTKKGATIQKIAKEAGVSIATVSRALNNIPIVDKNLQLKIMNIAERLGYHRFLEAQKLDAAKRNMKFIVVIFGRVGAHLLEQVEYGIDDLLRTTNYQEIRYLIDERVEFDSDAKKELFFRNIISEKGVVGILSAFVHLTDVTIANLYKNNLPVVLLNNHTEFGRCVTINNVNASYKAVKKFNELGRKQIGYIMPRERVAQVWLDRMEGYKQALRESGINFNPELIEYEDQFDVKQAGICTKILLERNIQLDAILYGSDLQAYGGIKMLRELGKKIPEEIAIIGFDDIISSSIIQPSLSSIRQPMYDLGKLGFQMLLRSITEHNYSPEKIVLETELILRKSCLANYEEEKWW